MSDYGINRQIVSFNLKPGDNIYADPGKLVSKTSNIIMEPKLVGGLAAALKRKFAGNAGMLTVFRVNDNSTGKLVLAGTVPGEISAISLGEGESFIVENGAFVASDGNVAFAVYSTNVSTAFFGGAGLIWQKMIGPGTIFIHAIGNTIEEDLLDNNSYLEVDPGHIAGFDSNLSFNVRFVDNVKSALYGGEGIFLASFKGKGKVLLHSASFIKMSSRIYNEGRSEAKGNGSQQPEG
jgi:uncharacterized protein (TIGR00266 family)